MTMEVDFALENQEQNLRYFVLILKREHWIRLGATHTVSLSEVREEARNCRKLLREKNSWREQSNNWNATHCSWWIYRTTNGRKPIIQRALPAVIKSNLAAHIAVIFTIQTNLSQSDWMLCWISSIISSLRKSSSCLFGGILEHGLEIVAYAWKYR